MSDVITFENDIADDGAGNGAGLFDDDDPFNLPPPLPPLSPQRDDDPINQDGDGDQTTGNSDKNEPNKKRRVKRSPRPKLDEVRLCNDRGIPALCHICDGIRFKGKGHEASDLTLLMQRYEHWAHRLFPKFPFVDVVDQVEKLGGKKLVQNCIKRIRRGEEDTVEDDNNSDTEIGQNINGSQGDGTPSQADGTSTTNNMQTFGVDVESRDKMVVLTPELQERIRLNRERALAKRKAAQEKQAEQRNTQTGQTDLQTGEIEQAEVQSTGNDGIAKDDDTTENLVMEDNSSAQVNDIEMEVETTEANDALPEESELEAETNADTATSTPIESTKESAVGKDIEMRNNESGGFVTGDAVIAQNEDSVFGAESGNIDGATVDSDLSNTIKDLPRHKDDSDSVNAQQLGEMSSSSSNVDQSAVKELNDEALQHEGCIETVNEPPREQAPDPNEPGGRQSMEMETEY